LTAHSDVAGCLHVHSRYTDGSYRYDEILQKARAAGLDFLLMTDHDNLDALRDGWQRWHDGLLCIVGVEISSRHGHIIAANISDCEGLNRRPLDGSLSSIHQQGGVAFAAHPLGKVKRLFGVKIGAWTGWDSPLYAGIELWCYMHDWIHDLRLGNFARFCRDPDAQITGPQPELLARWDRATQSRRLSAVGALDNHARNLPFHRFLKPLYTVLPHEYVFRTVRTHLQIKPPSGDAARDVPTILAALARGAGYVSYDLLADARGFDFTGRRGDAVLRMGDEAAAGSPIEFQARAPRHCELRLIRDGHEVAGADGTRLEYVLPEGEAGVMRVEARLCGRPWVFGNPIYVRTGVPRPRPSAQGRED